MDLRVLEPEEVVGLDHLEALVHQRGGVDRDLRPHRPHGVLEGLLHRRLRELRGRPAAERPAGARDHHPLEVLPALAAEGHREGRVLRVDREQPLGLTLDQVHHELAPDHERLLVRERERLAALERGERRPETEEPTSAFRTMSASVSPASRSAASGPTRSRPRGPSRGWPGPPRRRPRPRSRRRAEELRIWPSSSSWLVPAADSPNHLEPVGGTTITSSAWVPIEPVEPRMETLRMRTDYPVRKGTSCAAVRR